MVVSQFTMACQIADTPLSIPVAFQAKIDGKFNHMAPQKPQRPVTPPKEELSKPKRPVQKPKKYPEHQV